MKTSLVPSVSCEPGQIKAGAVIISRKRNENELLDRSLLLILEHDETGTTGIILNKPAVSPEERKGNEPLHYGGTYDTHRVGLILTEDTCEGRPVKISEGLFYCERCNVLNSKNFSEQLIESGQKAFIGFTVWQPGELEKELKENQWMIGDFQPELLKMNNTLSWERMSLKILNLRTDAKGINSPILFQ